MTAVTSMGTAVNVLCKLIDGAYFFVPDSRAASGLCAASPDLKTAFDEVACQLNVLFEHNYGQRPAFRPAVPFEIFKQALEASNLAAKGADQSGMIVPAMIQPWHRLPMN